MLEMIKISTDEYTAKLLQMIADRIEDAINSSIQTETINKINDTLNEKHEKNTEQLHSILSGNLELKKNGEYYSKELTKLINELSVTISDIVLNKIVEQNELIKKINKNIEQEKETNQESKKDLLSIISKVENNYISQNPKIIEAIKGSSNNIEINLSELINNLTTLVSNTILNKIEEQQRTIENINNNIEQENETNQQSKKEILSKISKVESDLIYQSPKIIETVKGIGDTIDSNIRSTYSQVEQLINNLNENQLILLEKVNKIENSTNNIESRINLPWYKKLWK